MANIPHGELRTYLATVFEALDLAMCGRVKDGYCCLLNALARAKEAAEAGEPWGLNLVRHYEETLLWYSQEWGLKVE